VSTQASAILLNEPPFEKELLARLTDGIALAFLSIDLINFNYYLEEHGWEKGDQILRMLAEVINDADRQLGNPDDYLAHVYLAMFAVITMPDRAEAIAQQVVTQFDQRVPSFYDEQARHLGYIDRVDRRGNPFRAPLMGVSIAIVSNEKRDLTHPLQIEHLANEVHNYIRLASGSRYAFDRRQK
jgi:GGDEF domain-containing protein